MPAGLGRDEQACDPSDLPKVAPGQFARVTLIHEVKPDALTVPEAAIVPKGEDQFVFKVVDGKAQLSRVSIGTRREGRVGERELIAHQVLPPVELLA